MKFLALLVLCAFSAVMADDWAVIVAGSNTYDNYRHQADVCHAYQIVSKNGIPDDHIIMLYFDDIATDPSNPYPGKIFNKPTAKGTAGVDVYAGCKKDYTGNDVTPKNFLDIIKGNATAMSGIGSGAVLQSGPNDNVFINFADHGGTGIICFPTGGYLHAKPLNDALQYMSDNKMFKKLVFYLEACESGSMFDKLLPTNNSIYATTAANPSESSWGTYCPPDDKINGKELNSCLGDLYSVSWMEDTDTTGESESLQTQFETVLKLTNLSHVMQYGDQSFTSDPISNFQGQTTFVVGRADEEGPINNPFHDRDADAENSITDAKLKEAGTVNSRDIPMHLAYYRYLRADKKDLTNSHRLAQDLLNEINSRMDADDFFSKLTTSFVGHDNVNTINAVLFNTVAAPVPYGECEQRVFAAYETSCGGFTDYSLMYTRVLYNLCAQTNSQTTAIVNAIRSMC